MPTPCRVSSVVDVGDCAKRDIIIPSGIAALAGPRPVWRGRTIKFYLLHDTTTLETIKGYIVIISRTPEKSSTKICIKLVLAILEELIIMM
jgi:hypothetical protein